VNYCFCIFNALLLLSALCKIVNIFFLPNYEIYMTLKTVSNWCVCSSTSTFIISVMVSVLQTCHSNQWHKSVSSYPCGACHFLNIYLNVIAHKIISSCMHKYPPFYERNRVCTAAGANIKRARVCKIITFFIHLHTMPHCVALVHSLTRVSF
jgi:hypothetical protein